MASPRPSILISARPNFQLISSPSPTFRQALHHSRSLPRQFPKISNKIQIYVESSLTERVTGVYLELLKLLAVMHFFSCESTEELKLGAKTLNISPML